MRSPLEALPSPRTVWSRTRETVRTELWPLPTAAVIVAIAAGILLPNADAAVAGDQGGVIAAYLFAGGPDAARTVLSAIASSMITVTSLTFSLTVVTLQLASSQFSPRLLRTFTRDRFVHVTLALFLATFSFALTVLRAVRTGTDGQAAFVPRLSVTLASLLTVASVFGLVLFLAHLAREIRVETMLVNVYTDASATVDQTLPSRTGAEPVPLPSPPTDAAMLTAGASGFLTYVDEHAVYEAACERGAVVVLERQPGASIVEGTPFGRAWSSSGAVLDDDDVDALEAAVRRAVSLGEERTAAQDVGFGLRQLTDVATKALSPGINDPTTAVHTLGHSSSLLCRIAQRDDGPRVLRDDGQRVRVVLARPGLPELLDVAVAQPRRYGASDPAVLVRIAGLLRELAFVSDDTHHRRAVADQLTRLRRTAGEQDFDPTEHAALLARLDDVDEALQGPWAPAANR